MKRGIAAAVGIALALIGGAVWLRFFRSRTVTNSLAVVPGQILPSDYYDNLVSKFLSATSTSATSTAALSTTDLVGRQMILDYLSLEQSGQASDDSLKALSDKYVNSLPTLLSIPSVNTSQMSVTADSEAAFQAYNDRMTQIYRTYTTTLVSASAGDLTMGPQGTATFTRLATLYGNTATQLEKMAVPQSLLASHLSLTNLYLSDQAAMQALTRSNSDPTSSFAGLLTYKANADKEEPLLSQIQEILSEHGI